MSSTETEISICLGTILNVVNNMTSSVANSGGIVGINSGSSAIVKNGVNYASSMSGLVWQNEKGLIFSCV